ncbi:MAG TPA: hypothetical protein VGD43_20995 [Micromonospora sp.]
MTTATRQTTGCAPWCPPEGCEPDRYDGSVFHMSQPVDVPTSEGTGVLDVCLTRLDEESEPGQVEVCVNVGADIGRSTHLTPAQTLAYIETLRAHALTAAGPDGVEIPVEQLRLGDELSTPNGWETVEVVLVDGWCCGIPPVGDHPHEVKVNTDAHENDENAYRYGRGDLVRIRAVTR